MSVILLRVKGLPLTKPPAYVDGDGFSVFHLNPEKVDWTDSCNVARAQIFPDVALPAVDRVFDEIMHARVTRQKAIRAKAGGHAHASLI